MKTATRPGPRVSKTVDAILLNSLRDELILTPAIDEFLLKWDGTIAPWVAERIAKIISTPPRVRSGSWSASGAGHCWRRQELAFLGMPTAGSTDPQLQRIFLNGTWVHLRTQAMLLTAGLLDGIEITTKKKSVSARCTMDGVGTATRGKFRGREFGFELKGRNDYAFKSQTIKGADEKTRKQVDFEFALTGLDLFVILNENKNNQEYKEWVILRDEDRVRDMKKQINELNKAIDNRKLHPMLDGCRKQLKTGEFWDCPFGGPGGACAAAGNWPRGV